MSVVYSPSEYVRKAQNVLADKVNIFQTFPNYVKNIINEKMWLSLKNEQGSYFKSFEELCVHRLWEGLDTTIEDLEIYLRNKPDIWKMALRELDEQNKESGVKVGVCNNINGKNKVTQKDNSDIITIIPKVTAKKKHKTSDNRGTSKTYILKRLKRDNPELAEKLINEEITANEAAILAGIRKTFIQVRADDIEKAIDKLIEHYQISKEQLIDIIDKV